jgi:site-specific recombinase XerD
MNIQSAEFKTLYAEFDSLMGAKGYATGKGTMYQSAVREFLLWMENKGIDSIKSFEPTNTIEYVEHLQTRPNRKMDGLLAASTFNHHLFGLRLFFDYLFDTNRIEKAMRLPKYNRAKGKQRSVLTREEVELLYSACETKRDRCLLSVAYGCGLRRTEIQELDIADLQFSTGMLIVREGKGKREGMFL